LLSNKIQAHQLRDVVKARVGRRVEDAEPAQEADALGLVGGLGRTAVVARAAAGDRVDECGCVFPADASPLVEGGLFFV